VLNIGMILLVASLALTKPSRTFCPTTTPDDLVTSLMALSTACVLQGKRGKSMTGSSPLRTKLYSTIRHQPCNWRFCYITWLPVDELSLQLRGSKAEPGKIRLCYCIPCLLRLVRCIRVQVPRGVTSFQWALVQGFRVGPCFYL